MHMKKAKEQIKNTLTAYFTKDTHGGYVLPLPKQRPIFLMGPPGIGKTAIVEQVAQELGVGMLSYSMTHHTRQSALGLPYIAHKAYDGVDYAVSEYTMSEIIASIYDLMEETGQKEGILFLDEINCVSETLAPIMLQFLQYKVFGRHKVPEGWVIVTAGNPPEYNNSVREFDIVTWDRLKRIDIEPDFDVWKEYAYQAGVHAAILSYLEIRKGDFYHVETTVDGKRFVTARGWDDLSRIITLYERNNLTVDEDLVSQYLQYGKVARTFAAYYDLFNKYRSDYQIAEILAGTEDDAIKERARKAGFDERLSLISLLLESLTAEARSANDEKKVLEQLLVILKQFRRQLTSKELPAAVLKKLTLEAAQKLAKEKKAGSISAENQAQAEEMLEILRIYAEDIASETDAMQAFGMIKLDFDRRVKEMKEHAAAKKELFNNLFTFAEEVFAEGHELLLIVTELTTNPYTAKYISDYGCEKYMEHSQDLLFYERQKKLMADLKMLDLDGGDED